MPQPARFGRFSLFFTSGTLILWALCTLGADRLAPHVQAIVSDVERLLNLDTVPPSPKDPS